jgi:hypothetical protein
MAYNLIGMEKPLKTMQIYLNEKPEYKLTKQISTFE